MESYYSLMDRVCYYGARLQYTYDVEGMVQRVKLIESECVIPPRLYAFTLAPIPDDVVVIDG